jgi:hypothetical protein
VSDYLLSFSGILPWRCQFCKTRFRARPSSLGSLIYAHCKICGSLDLQRIAPQRVQGAASILGRILGIPALRCAPCRHKFFSARPLRREPQREAAAGGD